jgi:drug/metabolite transporter (DMT)-like permease
MSQTQSQHRFLTILCFGLVYLLWGSTYLGIDIAIEHIPPALMCATRFLAAGTLMLLYCGLTGQSIVYDRQQFLRLAVIGVLLLVGGNLTLSYAEEYVPTGLAALLIAVTPLWFLVLDALLIGHHRISSRGLVGLGLGVVGTIVLLWPTLTVPANLGRREFWYSISLLGGSFSWALGSVLSKRWHSRTGSLSATGWQVTFAGLGSLLVAVPNDDFAHVVWTARGLGAVLYLVVCGSLIGYTCYIWLLAHVPTSKVSTYAYVNPLVAVFLGWLVLKERLDGYILVGSAIVVTSVVLVTSAKVEAKPVAEEMPATEAVGD